MLNNSQKAEPAKSITYKPEFHFILEQIWNWDIKQRNTTAGSMKSFLKPKDKDKNSGDPSSNCFRPDHIKKNAIIITQNAQVRISRNGLNIGSKYYKPRYRQLKEK